MSDKIYEVTKEGLQALKEELKHRIDEKRPETQKMLEEMRSAGDLRENDGYTLAIDDFQSNEARIEELLSLIENAKVKQTSNTTVGLGNTVEVKSANGIQKFDIVSPVEASPIEGKLSLETPIGQAIAGKKVGDKVTVSLPVGDLEFEIVSIK